MEISLDQEEGSWNLISSIVRIVKNFRFPKYKKKAKFRFKIEFKQVSTMAPPLIFSNRARC